MKKRNIILSILIVFLLILFAIFSIAVKNGKLDSFDSNVIERVLKFRGEKKGTIFWVVRLLTEFGFAYIIIIIILVALFFDKMKLKSTILGVGSASTFIVNKIVKSFVKRPRPLEELRWAFEDSYSYPSGHTMASAFLYFFLAYFIIKSNLKKWVKVLLSTICVIMPFVVAFTRVVLCVHFASDTIGALIFGCALVLIAILIVENLEAKGIKNALNSWIGYFYHKIFKKENNEE